MWKKYFNIEKQLKNLIKKEITISKELNFDNLKTTSIVLKTKVQEKFWNSMYEKWNNNLGKICQWSFGEKNQMIYKDLENLENKEKLSFLKFQKDINKKFFNEVIFLKIFLSIIYKQKFNYKLIDLYI